MESSHHENHGLPYPLDPTIPGPPERAGEQSQRWLRDDPLKMNHIGNSGNPFAALKYMDTILLIDDSDSMQSCWDEVGDILRIIAPICIEYDPNGIDIEFVNHRPSGHFFTGMTGYKHIGVMKGRLDMHDNVAGIYHNVKPKGKCRMDKRLASILDPYISECEARVRQTGGKQIFIPLNIIVISDMVWDPEEESFTTLIRTARKLDILGAPPYQVGVQLFRVGGADHDADEAELRFIDDEIWKQAGVRDIVDTTTWTGKPGELSANGILKVLLGGVRRSIDYMKV